MRFANLNSKDTLRIYCVAEKSLSGYRQKNKYGFSSLPSEELRLQKEEIQGTEEIDAKKNAKAETKPQEKEDDQFADLLDDSESSLAFDPDENRFSMSAKMDKANSKDSKGVNKDKQSFDFEKRSSVLVRAKPNTKAVTLEDFDL